MLSSGRQLTGRVSEVEVGAGQADRQAELDGEFEVDVEQLRSETQRLEVGTEVGEVEPPEDGPLDLGLALPSDLVDVGVLTQIGRGTGKSPVAVEQRRRIGDRAPPIQVVLGQEGQ